METALTVLIWVVAISIAAWILISVLGLVFGGFIFGRMNKKFDKEWDNHFKNFPRL